MDGIYGGVVHEYWNRASVHCAPLQTLKSFEDRPKSEKLEVPVLYLHCFSSSYLRDLPRCSPDIEVFLFPLVLGQIFWVSPVYKSTSQFCYTGF
jgi:hypothetical protein